MGNTHQHPRGGKCVCIAQQAGDMCSHRTRAFRSKPLRKQTCHIPLPGMRFICATDGRYFLHPRALVSLWLFVPLSKQHTARNINSHNCRHLSRQQPSSRLFGGPVDYKPTSRKQRPVIIGAMISSFLVGEDHQIPHSSSSKTSAKNTIYISFSRQASTRTLVDICRFAETSYAYVTPHTELSIVGSVRSYGSKPAVAEEHTTYAFFWSCSPLQTGYAKSGHVCTKVADADTHRCRVWSNSFSPSSVPGMILADKGWFRSPGLRPLQCNMGADYLSNGQLASRSGRAILYIKDLYLEFRKKRNNIPDSGDNTTTCTLMCAGGDALIVPVGSSLPFRFLFASRSDIPGASRYEPNGCLFAFDSSKKNEESDTCAVYPSQPVRLTP